MGGRETVHVTSTQWVDPDTGEVVEHAEPEAADDSSWQSEFEWVLNHPGDYPVNSAAQYTPDGTYEYALVEANGGGTPELLLAVSSGHTQPVIVFTIGDDGKAHASPEVLIMGTPGNGAAREGVAASASGNGIYQISGSAGSREHLSRHFVLDGASLSKASEETFNITQGLPDHQNIEWTPTGDKSALTAGVPVGSGSGSASGSDGASGELQAGQVEFTGTVRGYTGEELMAPLGYGMPNGEDPNSVYYVLDLDSPLMVRGRTAPGYKTEEVKRFRLGHDEIGARGHSYQDGLEWAQYVDKRVRIVVDEGDVNFPTDTSMPLGTPGFGESMTYTVLE
ncbi:hypothetical protein [Corynebacterium jeddahense]|uniref:hypothetical protein n=1 Tax=Corynebacterium jeddahense TaxID=1414719 RepID=UPI0004BA1114|nr:hypothetical protein [Corynebacterium jeddahense]